jgi:hypothetical protein
LLSKLTQFSQGNNFKDAQDFNMKGFLKRETCFSTSHVNNANLDKNDLSHLESFDLQEIFLPITNSIFTGKQ